MRKNKIIGLSVAAFGVITSLGAALALYTANAENVSFGIAAGTYEGSTSNVNYRITNAVEGKVAPEYHDHAGELAVEGAKLSPENNIDQLKYAFTLGATFAEDLATQTNVMGKVSFSLTNLKPALYEKVTVWAGVQGYADNTLGSEQFSGALVNDLVIEDEDTECTGEKCISVAAAGAQSLVIWVKFNLAGMTSYGLDELGDLFTLNVRWEALPNDYEVPYVVGDKTMWEEDDEFAMAVDIASEPVGAGAWVWAYNGIKGTDFSVAKVKKGSVWSAGDNAELNPAKVYDVTWLAAETEQAVFTPRS